LKCGGNKKRAPQRVVDWHTVCLGSALCLYLE